MLTLKRSNGYYVEREVSTDTFVWPTGTIVFSSVTTNEGLTESTGVTKNVTINNATIELEIVITLISSCVIFTICTCYAISVWSKSKCITYNSINTDNVMIHSFYTII